MKEGRIMKYFSTTVISLCFIFCLSSGVYAFTFTTIDHPNATQVHANGINDSDVITGNVYTCAPCSYSGGKFAFIDDGNNFSFITHPNSIERTYGTDINNSNAYVGYYLGTNDRMSGYLSDGNNFTTIVYPGSTYNHARGINDSMKIVGFWDDGDYSDGFVYRSFIYNHNDYSYVLFPDYPDSKSTFAYDINNTEIIVGTYRDQDNLLHGFIYNDGSFQSFDHPSGDSGTVFSGINDDGTVVGSYYNTINGQHSFVYKSGTFIPLDYPNSVGTEALRINNASKVVGQYSDGTRTYGFLSIPNDNDGDGFSEIDECDDSDATVYPSAPELCDGKDNDCNGIVDDITNTYWVDGDGDGYGDLAFPVDLIACSTPIGYSDNSDDCDDADATVYPGASELCDGKDNDCDGVIPSNEIDDDGDGVSGCEGDCDETDPTVYSGASELCDGKDNDCDGVVPANEVDDDGDGFSECEGDCNDSDATVFPGAIDVPENGIDEDCNGADLTWEEEITSFINVINTLDPGVFKKPKDQDKLTKELEKVLKEIEKGKDKNALKELNKVLEDVDGCALTGSPDWNDKIKDCDAQDQIYQEVLEAITLLQQN